MFWQAIATPTSTPPGLWNKIAQVAAVSQSNTLVQNARMFALLDLTLADEAIACWDAKYTYNFWRPVTAIRAADTTGNPDTDPDPTWTPLLATPSHPSYPSAHATELGGAAAALTSFFGTDALPFSISWEGLPGVTRTFAGFTAAGDEATMSRIWAGIHWSFDIDAGHALGLSVAGYISQNWLLPRTSPPPSGSPASIVLAKGSIAPGSTSLPTDVTARAWGETIVHPTPADTSSNSAVSKHSATATSPARLVAAHAQSRASCVDDLFGFADTMVLMTNVE